MPCIVKGDKARHIQSEGSFSFLLNQKLKTQNYGKKEFLAGAGEGDSSRTDGCTDSCDNHKLHGIWTDVD